MYSYVYISHISSSFYKENLKKFKGIELTFIIIIIVITNIKYKIHNKLNFDFIMQSKIYSVHLCK